MIKQLQFPSYYLPFQSIEKTLGPAAESADRYPWQKRIVLPILLVTVSINYIFLSSPYC